MNLPLANAVVDFLAVPSDERALELGRFRPRQWHSSMHWLVTSGLALYLLEELRRAGQLHVVPAATRATLEEMWSASEARVQSLQATLFDLNQRFCAAGLRFANWKGFATVPEFCPDARLRSFSDFDFLVDQESLERGSAILASCGYVMTERSDAEVRFETLPGSLTPFARSYHTSAARRVELHTRLNGAIGNRRLPDYTDLLDRRVVERRQGADFPVLCLADAFLLHALHCSRHFMDGWVRVGWLLEVRNFLRGHRADQGLWREIDRRAHLIPGCAELVGIASWLCACLLGERDSECLDWALRSIRPSAIAWLQRFGRPAALAEFPGTKLPLLLVRELADHESWAELQKERSVRIRRPAKISRPLDSSLRQRAIAAAWQIRYAWMRLRFQGIEGARYYIEKRRWDRVLARSAAQHTSLIS